MRILVVDDTPLICDLLAFYLKSAGFETVVAGSASEAAAALEAEAFDLLLLDLMMPQMDGLQFLEQMRLQARYKALPVMVLTSSHNSSDVLRARRLGVREYVLKDNLSSALLDRIRVTLGAAAAAAAA